MTERAVPLAPALAAGRYVLLTYDYVAGMLERRGPHREAHLAHATAAREAGHLVNVGAVGEAAEGAILLFGDVERAVAERHAVEDPYQHAGLIRSWRVVPWQVVDC